ncbi:hypothetical protein Tco_0195144 [Tanacetum coccineum]
MIKRHLLLAVGAIVKKTPRRRKFVSWHLTTMRKRIEQLERNKEACLKCESCDILQSKVSSLSLKLASFESSSLFLQEMLENQKTQKDKLGIGFTEDIASSSKTITKKLGPVDEETPIVEPAVPVPSARKPASSNEGNRPFAEESEILESNVLKRNSSVQITRKPSSNTPVRLKVKLEPDEWIKDSGCSRHMTRNKDLFSTYKAIDGGNMVFGSNTKSKIIGKERGDGVPIIKRRRQDLHREGVRDPATASERGRLKEDLESSTWRWRHDFKAMPSHLENPEQAFFKYASSCTDKAGGKWYTFKPKQNNLGDTYNPSWKSQPNLRWRQPQDSQNNFSNPPNRFQPNGSIPNRSFNNNPQNFNNQSNLKGLVSSFMASQDARLSKFNADFKQQQREMTNKIDTILKAIADRIAEALPSDTVKNLKLNVNSTSLVLSARSYLTKDPQCSTQIHGPSRNDKEREIEWLDFEEPLDLVDTSKESVYESLIKEMPKCSLNYDFRIKKGDPRNLKIPCMIGHKFMANAYIDVDLLMNIMSLAYYNTIRKNGYEYMGRNFIGLGRDMHVFVGNMSYVMEFTILENIETNIDPSLSRVIFGQPFAEIACLAIDRKHGLMTLTDGTKEVTFKTPYKDPERSELSSEGHDLLSSRIILSEDDYDRGCRKPSDLEDGFYRDTIKLGPEYVTEKEDE